MKGVLQHDLRDCGPACLATSLHFNGINVPLREIRELMHVNKQGASIFSICSAAKSYGFIACGYKISTGELFDVERNSRITFPCIVHTAKNNFMHYIVVFRTKKNRVVYFDPARGKRICNRNEFESIFTGYVIFLHKHEDNTVYSKRQNDYYKYMHFISREKLPVICVITISLVLSSLSIISAMGYRTLIDKYILGNVTEDNIIPVLSDIFSSIELRCTTLTQLFMVLILIILVQSILFLIQNLMVTHLYKRSGEYLYSMFYKNMCKLRISFFRERESGEILSRFEDIGKIQEFILQIGITLMVNVIMVIVGGGVLCSINLTMFITVVINLLIYVLAAFIYIRPTKRVTQESLEANSLMVSKLREAFSGAISLKSLGAQKYILKDLDKYAGNLVSKNKNANVLLSTQSFVLGLLNGVGDIILIWIGMDCVMNGVISLGSLLAFLVMTNFFVTPLQSLIMLQIQIQSGLVAAKRMDDVVEGKKYERGRKNKLCGVNCISAHDLRFAYSSERRVINKCSFYIKSGDVVAITGLSGCGKSTLGRIISGLETEYEGLLFINGEPIQNLSEKDLNKIMYLSQQTIIFSDTIENNILLGMEKPDNFDSIISGCLVDDIIKKKLNGINEYVSEDGCNLSGGEIQRIAIARALVRKPEVLILDETTCHMDSKVEDAIIEYLLSQKNIAILIFISHNKKISERCNVTIEL